MKTTWEGRLVAEASRVMEMELVFDARIAEAFAILSSSMNSFFLTSSDSTIASMMRSQEFNSSSAEVQWRRCRAALPSTLLAGKDEGNSVLS